MHRTYIVVEYADDLPEAGERWWLRRQQFQTVDRPNTWTKLADQGEWVDKKAEDKAEHDRS